jgi:predicted nucleic acid-binding protein
MLDRVYFDTNIWLSALDSQSLQHNAAKAQFENVRHGKQKLIISNWVFLEIYKKIIDAAMRDPSVQTSKKPEAVRAYASTAFSKYLALVLQMSHVVFSDPSTRTNKLLQGAYDMSQRVFGNVSKEIRCPVCSGVHNFFKYHGPYEIDLIHALLAKELRCRRILTFDHDFSLLKNDPLIQPLIIEVLTK